MVALTRRGCLKNFVIFLAILISMILISSILIYKHFDGQKGIRRWIVSKATDGAQNLVLKQRPDGISKKEIEQTFERLKYAIKDDQVDLNKLYQILEKYQENFQNDRPSDQEMAKFLEDIRSTITKSET